MKQKLLILLTFFTLATGTLWAYDFSAPNADGVEIYYNILNGGNTVEVTSKGSVRYTGSINIPSSVTYNGIEYTVTTIDAYAFSSCSSLTNIIIPNSVTTIGAYAFSSCSGLTLITIPNSVTTIGEGAFASCDGLTTVTIPNSVKTLGNGSFHGCNGLTAFYGKYASEDNRCWIVDGVLNSFAPAGLTSYTIPNLVTTIGADAFHGCKGITSVTIPNTVTAIERNAFFLCI